MNVRNNYDFESSMLWLRAITDCNVTLWWLRRQIKQVWKEAPIESGMLDYLKFVKIIKRGKDDD